MVGLLWTHHPDRFDESLYGWLVLCGFVGGAGGATFPVGVPQTSCWHPVGYGRVGYARGFVVLLVLSAVCALVSYGLKLMAPAEGRDVSGDRQAWPSMPG